MKCSVFLTLEIIFVLVFAILTASYFNNNEIFFDAIKCFSPENISAMANFFDAIAWPILILTLALIFKKNITSVITTFINSKKFSVGVGGFNYEAKNQNNSEIETIKSIDEVQEFSNISSENKKDKNEENKALQNENKTKSYEYFLKREPLIDTYISLLAPQYASGARKLNMKETDFLKAKATEFYLFWRFEQIYSSIYKSQIEVIQLLATKGGKCEKHETHHLYENARQEYPFVYNAYYFENWISFLETQSLVTTSETNIALTGEAYGFLKYVNEHKKYVNKFY